MAICSIDFARFHERGFGFRNCAYRRVCLCQDRDALYLKADVLFLATSPKSIGLVTEIVLVRLFTSAHF